MSNNAEENYLKQHTSYGDIAYADDNEGEYEEPDPYARGEAKWEFEDGR